MPFRNDTLIWLASATKIVTATASLIAVDKGLFRLDDVASKYIPELEDMEILVGFDADRGPIDFCFLWVPSCKS